VNDEFRAITKSHLKPESAVMNVLDDAIREILLLGIAAHVRERQNGDGGLVGERE